MDDRMFRFKYDVNEEQMICPASLIRGGTSRAIYFKAEDIPSIDNGQAKFLAAAMGRPGSSEIDGIGGGQFATSKVAIVRASQRKDADVDYTFVQVVPMTNQVVYDGNCGNISSGVPTFALDKNLITLPDGEHEMRIWNTNTEKMLYATFTVKNNQAVIVGDYKISGIPGTGSKVFMDFRETIGAKTGRIFPTGNIKDTISMEDGTKVEVTICDVSNLVIYIDSVAVGCNGAESIEELNSREALFDRCAEIRGKAVKLIGLVAHWQDGKNLMFPPVCMVHKPISYKASDGTTINANDYSLMGKLVVVKTIHPTFMGTGSCCFAAAANVSGTVPNEILSKKTLPNSTFTFGHPGGLMSVEISLVSNRDCNKTYFTKLGFGRTSRKIADCLIYTKIETMNNLMPDIILPTKKGALFVREAPSHIHSF